MLINGRSSRSNAVSQGGTTSHSDERLYLSMVVEEYRSLHEQVRQAITNMFMSLQWGAVILASVVAVGLSQWEREHFLVIVVFVMVVPFLCVSTAFLWLGEAARLIRTDDYLYLVELKVASVIEGIESLRATRDRVQNRLREEVKSRFHLRQTFHFSRPLYWEQWLKGFESPAWNNYLTTGYLTWVYIVRGIIFVAIIWLSLLAGAYYMVGHPTTIPAWLSWATGSGDRTSFGVSLILLGSWLGVTLSILLISSVPVPLIKSLVLKLARRRNENRRGTRAATSGGTRDVAARS